jgi:A/G-specific adenine glycosylase
MLRQGSHFTRRLLRWYGFHRRPLPWRTGPDADPRLRPDPYHVLVSESMLQQTQVATVIPYFTRFIRELPTLEALSQAPEQQVLRLWQGLGYYSRARNLHRAARQVVQRHGGMVPDETDALLELPGIGRYTAGAIASLAFDRRAPILDGNVMRVLCRLDGIDGDPRTPNTNKHLWWRAEQIMPRRRSAGDFNSALMELGATICTPRSPACGRCPVRLHCEAFAADRQNDIPPPRAARQTPILHRWTFCIHHEGRWLIEQRPARGRWARMWQFLTIDPAGSDAPKDWLARHLRITSTSLRQLASLSHTVTHRRYRFDIYCCTGRPRLPDGAQPRAWTTLGEISHYPLPRPHLRIVQMLQQV